MHQATTTPIFTRQHIKALGKKKVAIIRAEQHADITEKLYRAARDTLLDHGITAPLIEKKVPGSFELPLAATILSEKTDIDALVCLGCVVQGETRHFDYLCSAVSHALLQVSIASKKPIGFGLLTVDTIEQAQARAGDGVHGNKGKEAALAVLQMLCFEG